MLGANIYIYICILGRPTVSQMQTDCFAGQICNKQLERATRKPCSLDMARMHLRKLRKLTYNLT